MEPIRAVTSFASEVRLDRRFRIGQIVPSSNTTMETEIPAMLRARESIEPDRFTFHSSRMRMQKVTREELEAMDRDSDRCAVELADARVDVLGYACLDTTGSRRRACSSVRPMPAARRLW
jgi:maleate cis-trans isomerase